MKNLTLLLLFASTIVLAQNHDSKGNKDAVAKLGNLVGKWHGQGWTQRGNSRTEFSQEENVQLKLDGTALLIEGRGSVGDSVMFQAMAMISFNNEARNYRFNSLLADGRYTEAVGAFNDDGSFDWQFPVPNGGTIKYHIVFSKTEWQEKGYYSPDGGKQWYPFLEMNLTKSNN